MANDGSVAAIHALWTFHGLGQLDDAAHRAALAAKDPALRRNAIRALGDDERSNGLLFAAGSISDPEPHTRLASLVQLARFPASKELQTLVLGLTRDAQAQADEWMREATRLLAKKHDAQGLPATEEKLLTGDA